MAFYSGGGHSVQQTMRATVCEARRDEHQGSWSWRTCWGGDGCRREIVVARGREAEARAVSGACGFGGSSSSNQHLRTSSYGVFLSPHSSNQEQRVHLLRRGLPPLCLLCPSSQCHRLVPTTNSALGETRRPGPARRRVPVSQGARDWLTWTAGWI